jgi:hypothetical protein
MPDPLLTEHASDLYVTYVARLWVVVGKQNAPTNPETLYDFAPANHRFFTHFGEDHCRMSATHSVVDTPAGKRNLILTTISKALFDLPTEHRERLENLWVDELVYGSAWRKHVSERVEDLLQKMTWVSGNATLVR